MITNGEIIVYDIIFIDRSRITENIIKFLYQI